ncbi:MAG: carboxypeptidase-like regulatory domain-containing protein [Armatimonadota bacterium]|nr:carboxypeptidase-like regulatory domain-containing protein [Armatimonadota bacterium]
MARDATSHEGGAVVVLLAATLGGLLAVLASLLGFSLLVGEQATEAEVMRRIGEYVYWSQPPIYIMAGLLAGARDPRRGPLRAPIIGLFLGAVCWLMLRRQGLLPPATNIIAYLLPAAALITLVGAMIAPLLRERAGTAAGAVIVIAIGAFIYAFLNLGAISGVVQREVIQRAGGMTTAMNTVPVANAPVVLVRGDTVLYEARSNNAGRFHISQVALGAYTLRVGDPVTNTVVSQPAEVERSITGGTKWQTVALPSITRDAGRIFE